MAAPFPYDAQAGRVSLKTVAERILGHYKWLARWSDELNTDPEVDLKKLAQLAFVHCVQFRNLIQPFLPVDSDNNPIVEAVWQVFAEDDVTWPDKATMRADLGALFQRCGTFNSDVLAAWAEPRSYAELRWNQTNGAPEEVALTTPKPSVYDTMIANMRAEFA